MTLAYRYQHAYEAANRYDQEHIFTFWDELNDEEREKLLDQAEGIDYAFIEDQFKKRAYQQPDIEGIEPPAIITKHKVSDHIIGKGEDAIRKGKVAVFVVAGGQGSRLGFEGPKGCFKATPIKQKPIFQVLAEKLLAVNNHYDTSLELYIMTSETNHEDTKKFFEEHDHFGLDKEKIVFFKQQMHPVVDEQGKVLMKTKAEIVMAPSGTGGIYEALLNGGIIERMEEEGIEMLHYIQVDNPLVEIADPVFIGQHLFEESEMSCKIVEKAYPDEKVGVYVHRNGKAELIEYVFMLEELLYKKDDEGKLAYRAGNIANHVLDRKFIKRVATTTKLNYVLAHKRVPHINQLGEKITPLKPNAYKLECFVFDALPKAENPVIMAVTREEEFAPIKNAEGRDSPDSAKNLMVAQGKRWLQSAGVHKEVLDRLEIVEISPLFAHTEKAFVQKAKHYAHKLSEQLKGKGKAYLQ